MKRVFRTRYFILSFSMLVGIAINQSCTESLDVVEPSAEEMLTETPVTIVDYLRSNEDYSEYCGLLDAEMNSSAPLPSIAGLLSGKGNYTLFVPTNEAVRNYLSKLQADGVISQASWDAPEFQDRQLFETTRQDIVYNSIVNNSDVCQAYETADFDMFLNTNLEQPNLMDMSMVITKVTGDANSDYAVNGSKISKDRCDIGTANGFIHQVETVVSPDVFNVSDYFRAILRSRHPGHYVYASLLDACGLLPELAKTEDMEYHRQRMEGKIQDLETHPSYHHPGYMPEHRYYGFTLFLENDEWWTQALGVANLYDLTPREIVQKVADYVVQNQFHLPGASAGESYADEDNALNQFVTYHIVPARIRPDKLVIHYNELFYSVANTSAGMSSVFDYYTTMGKRRLLKTFEPPMVYGDGRKGVVFLNRFPELDNGRYGRYDERYCREDKKGVEILNGEEMVNSYIYDINDVLYYNQEIADNMSGERIRVDAASIFKEFITNDIRSNELVEPKAQCVGMPQTETYAYLSDCEIGSGSRFYYLSGRVSKDGSYCWLNYQGDEIAVVGNYEITIKLPPVPKDGTYELRMGVSANNRRGMCQVYWGQDKDRLHAVGTPLDLRMGGTKWYYDFNNMANTGPSIVGWEDDVPGEDIVNAEIDKRLRNNGYMKAPNSYWSWTASASADLSRQIVRRRPDVLRKIILTEEMRADKTYYIRFKSILNNSNAEFYLDYLEFCEKKVYDSLVLPEDIW